MKIFIVFLVEFLYYSIIIRYLLVVLKGQFNEITISAVGQYILCHVLFYFCLQSTFQVNK